jgi:hypothetical protein
MNSYEQTTQEVRDAFDALCKGRVKDAVEVEREACAKECERMMMYPNAKQESAAHQDVWAAAKAIRARGSNT